VKPRQQVLGIVGDFQEKDLQRDVAIQFDVVRAVDGAHAARTEGGTDLVRSDTTTWRETQGHGMLTSCESNVTV